MINKVITFLAAELNVYLKNDFEISEDKVVVSPIVNTDGSTPVKNQDKIVVTLINIQQEASIRNNISFKTITPTPGIVNPPLYIDLYILFSANFTDYQESLKFISSTISFFRDNAVFSQEKYPQLDTLIDHFEIELDATSYQDWNSIWAMNGGNSLPAVVYKLRQLSVK